MPPFLTRAPASLHTDVTEGMHSLFLSASLGTQHIASMTFVSYASLGSETPDWDHPHVRCPASVLHNAKSVHSWDSDGEISSLQKHLEDVTFQKFISETLLKTYGPYLKAKQERHLIIDLFMCVYSLLFFIKQINILMKREKMMRRTEFSLCKHIEQPWMLVRIVHLHYKMEFTHQILVWWFATFTSFENNNIWKLCWGPDKLLHFQKGTNKKEWFFPNA